MQEEGAVALTQEELELMHSQMRTMNWETQRASGPSKPTNTRADKSKVLSEDVVALKASPALNAHPLPLAKLLAVCR